MSMLNRANRKLPAESRNVPAHPVEFLNFLEEQLRLRLSYPYVWHKLQDNSWDHRTNFIYHIANFSNLVNYLQSSETNIHPGENLFDYALARWYNHWSAQAVEKIFSLCPQVSSVDRESRRRADFRIGPMTFDHKTSVFPKGYQKSLSYAINNERSLIEWLYTNQSVGQRKHYKNRLFVILFANHGEHWKLKAEISLLREVVEAYMDGYDPDRLEQFEFFPGEMTASDIIWGIQ